MVGDPCAPCSGTGHVITGKAVLSSDVINYYRRLYHRDLIHVRMNELKDVKTGDETTRGYVDERLRELGDQLKSTIEAQGGEEHYIDELFRLFGERLSVGVCPECIGTGIKMGKEENTHA